MQKNVFVSCMTKYMWMLPAEIVLMAVVSYTLVQGMDIISVVIDDMLAGGEVALGSFILRFLLFTAVGAMAAFAQSIISSKYAMLVCTEYRDNAADKLYRMEYRYFDEHYSAELLNKVTGDLGEISTFLETLLPEIISSLISLITYSVYIGHLNIGLMATILISYPLIFWIASALVKKIRGLQASYRQKTDVMAAIAQDAVSGILVLRSFGAEHIFSQKMRKASEELVENEEKRAKISNAVLVIRKVIEWLPNIISAVYAVYLVSRGKVSLGGLVAFILILDKFVKSFIGLPLSIVDASAGLVSIKRMEEILAENEECGGTQDKPLDTDTAVCFDKADFGYSETELILDKLSFEVKTGENVAFVGESGGGKSTIFRLLCGFYRLSGGQYRLFGRDMADWNIQALRQQIAVVSQNVFLFPDTIEKNISYGKPDASIEEVMEACRKAEIHDFIMTLPQGYRTVIGERGAILSGGQKQRISIGRAIIKNAPILLLDEPTSALDVETESSIKNAIDTMVSGKTCITIAHRLSTVVNADKIMVLKHGRIVESGTHDELMALGQAYAKMYRNDMRGC